MSSDLFEKPLSWLVLDSRPITYGIVQPGPDISPDGIPLIRGKDYSSGKVATAGLYRVSPAIDRPYARSKVKGGDLLLSIVGYVGQVAEVPVELDGANITQTTARISVDPGKADSTFLLQYLSAPHFRAEITRYEKGSAQPGLNLSDVQRLRIKYPPIPQQQRIAEILSTVDRAMEQTEALIAKYRQIKAGLMHDLFTRGVTPDGQLRPTRKTAPQLYKNSPLGWIPKEWDCLALDKLLGNTLSPMRSGPFGSALLKNELVEDGIPLLGIDNVFVERFEPIFRRFVSRQKFNQLIRYAVFPGDVVITIMGTVGRSCQIPHLVHEALSSKHIWTMTFESKKIVPVLVCWQLNHAAWVKKWFARQSQGAVMEAISSSTLRNLRLPVPKIDEQKLIVKFYRSSNELIVRESDYLAKLRSQKQGLMRDLLTGRVPVKI
jgi:type I restriction enzyme, S subunit